MWISSEHYQSDGSNQHILPRNQAHLPKRVIVSDKFDYRGEETIGHSEHHRKHQFHKAERQLAKVDIRHDQQQKIPTHHRSRVPKRLAVEVSRLVSVRLAPHLYSELYLTDRYTDPFSLMTSTR